MYRETMPLPTAAAALVVLASTIAFLGTSDLPGSGLGIRRFLTPEITGNVRVAQSFRMTASGLDGISIYPAVIGPARGKIRLELRAIKDESTPLIRAAEIDVATFVTDDSFLFSFDPVTSGYRYSLELLSSSHDPSSGVALWATKGDRLEGGTFSMNGIERWGELAFQTHAKPSYPDGRWSRQDLMRRHLRFAVAGLLVSWIALVLVLRHAASP